MYNKKVLREATKNLDRTVAPAKKKDMIIDPMGQWNHPGQNTRIPGNDITMQGVQYPVWAVPNVGMPQMMYPEQNYNFPGAEYVDEYPQMQKGGISFKDLIEVDYPTEMFEETATWNPDGTYSTIKKYYDHPTVKRSYPQYLDEWTNTTPEGKRIVRNAQDRLREVKNKKALWEREQEVKGATEEERKKLMLQPAGQYSFQKGGDISIPDLNQYEDGGEYDLTQEEIDNLIAQGYQVEDVDTDEYKKGGTPRSLPKKKSSKAYSRSLTATNKLFAESELTKKSKSRKNKIFDPNAKYYQDGGVSPLEGNYLSKVIMNRNRGTDFVDRAYALGANPGTPIFNVPDDEQFGAYMSHKMAYGEDDSGKTWMFPTVLNPNNEAIEVPGQYADYISSEGYKYATGMKQKGGFQDDLGKHRKLIRDWTYGQSIGMLQRAQEGLDTGVVESKTPWAGAANFTGEETTPPVIFEGKDVTVKAEAPKWAGYQKEYQNANPWDRYLAGEKNKYIRKNKGLNKAAGVSASNFPKDAEERIRQEYDRKMNTYTTRRLGKYFDYNPRQRGEWIDLLTPKEKEIVAGSKYGSKLQPDAWSRFMSGTRSIYNAGPLSNITGDITTPIRGYTERENKEALNNWAEGMEALAPLDVPGMVVANKMKNMNAENPSWYSGEMMGNVDYGDVVAMNPLTLLDIYGLPKAGVSLGRGVVKGSQALGKTVNKVKSVIPKTTSNISLTKPVRSGLGGIDMSRYEIKNPEYFTQLLNTYDNKALPASNRKFYKDLIDTVKKQNGVVTERQYNELQRLKKGNFDFGSKGYNKGYQEGGITEEAEYTDAELTPEEIDWYLANGYDLEELPDDYEMPMAQGGFEIQGLRTQPVKSSQPKPKAQVKEDVVVSKQSAPSKITIEGLRTAPVVEKQSSGVTPYVQSIFDKRAAQPYVAPKKEVVKTVKPIVVEKEKVVAAPKDVFSKSKYAYQPLSGYLQNNPIVPEQKGLTPYAANIIRSRGQAPVTGKTVPGAKPLSAQEEADMYNILSENNMTFSDKLNRFMNPETNLFDKEIAERNSIEQQQAKRFLQKEGVIATQEAKLDLKKAKAKEPIKEVTPKPGVFYQELGSVKDLGYTNNDLLSYRNQWDNNNGFVYIATPVKQNRTGKEVYPNVKGVAHFNLDASPSDKATYMHPNNVAYIRKAKNNNDYIPVYESLGNDKVKLQYKKYNELPPEKKKEIDKLLSDWSAAGEYDQDSPSQKHLDIAKRYAETQGKESQKIVSPLRQMQYDDIRFDQVNDKLDGFQKGIKEVKKSDGQGTYLLFKSRDGYSRFSGGSVVFIFKDQYGNTIVRDYAGSLNGIENEGINIKKQYNLKPGQLTMGYHDVGSFSAKPKADSFGTLKSSQWEGFNNAGNTGGALLIPND